MSYGDWQHGKKFPWPYKGGLYGCLSDPKYIADRNKVESESLHTWYQNDGKGWSMDTETPMEYQRRRRKARGET